MSRYINPINRYWTNDGSVLAFGSVEFLQSGIGTRLAIFSDEEMETTTANPQPLDATGRLLSVFYEGIADVIVRNSAGVLQDQDDPVGGEQTTGELSLWNALITYVVASMVKGSDGKFYISLINPNINNNPTSPSPSSWTEFRLLGVYNASETYSIGDVVQELDGSLWASQVNSNLANTPSTDGGTNWIPAVAGVKIAEVITLEARTTTVLPKTGAVALTALRINEVQNAGPFTLPAANSVAANQIITIDFPDEFKAFVPVINRAGSDTITNGDGTDTSITLLGSIRIILVSDGISDWHL